MAREERHPVLNLGKGSYVGSTGCGVYVLELCKGINQDNRTEINRLTEQHQGGVRCSHAHGGTSAQKVERQETEASKAVTGY